MLKCGEGYFMVNNCGDKQCIESSNGFGFGRGKQVGVKFVNNDDWKKQCLDIGDKRVLDFLYCCFLLVG